MGELGDVNAESLHSSETILQVSYALHDKFESTKWQGKNSFHNAEHILAVATAADKLISSAENGADPLAIQADIQKWNNQHPNSLIDTENLGQFKKISRIAFAAHDWGNIMSDIEFDKNGSITPKYLEKYTSNGAELRSQAMLEKFIQNSKDIRDDEKSLYINVGKEIIWQTVFMFEEDDSKGEEPFAKFTRICDQIGNEAFSTNKNRVEGLLMEMYEENSNSQVNPYDFFNFAKVRIKGILDKEGQPQKVEDIYKIWGKPLPEEVYFHKNESIRVSEVLNTLNAQN